MLQQESGKGRFPQKELLLLLLLLLRMEVTIMGLRVTIQVAAVSQCWSYWRIKAAGRVALKRANCRELLQRKTSTKI